MQMYRSVISQLLACLLDIHTGTNSRVGCHRQLWGKQSCYTFTVNRLFHFESASSKWLQCIKQIRLTAGTHRQRKGRICFGYQIRDEMCFLVEQVFIEPVRTPCKARQKHRSGKFLTESYVKLRYCKEVSQDYIGRSLLTVTFLFAGESCRS